MNTFCCNEVYFDEIYIYIYKDNLFWCCQELNIQITYYLIYYYIHMSEENVFECEKCTSTNYKAIYITVYF